VPRAVGEDDGDPPASSERKRRHPLKAVDTAQPSDRDVTPSGPALPPVDTEKKLIIWDTSDAAEENARVYCARSGRRRDCLSA
jgi:hypothetical protein